MENSSLSLFPDREDDHRLPNDPSLSLDRQGAGHSDACKTRPRIIYRTSTNSICVTENNDCADCDSTTDQNRQSPQDDDTIEVKVTADEDAYDCGDDDINDSGLCVADHDQPVNGPANPSRCLLDIETTDDVTTNYDDAHNNDQYDDYYEGSSSSDSEETNHHEMPGQESKPNKLYPDLYFNHSDSATSKEKQKPNNNNNSASPIMDNYQCCCPANKTSSKCINNDTNSKPKEPQFSAKLTINIVPQTPAGSRVQEQLKPIPMRMSAPVGILWTLLSIMVAGTCSFSFLQPFWFTHPQTGDSFGMYSYCIRDTRYMPGIIQTCGIYGGHFRFSNVPSHSWQAACVLYGGGCALLCFAALLAICSMCAERMRSKKIAICSGYIQLMAVLIMVGGLLVFPLGLDTRFCQHYCGRSAGPYNSADCQLGWGYMLAIMGTALSIFCPFLSQYTDMKVSDSPPK